MALHSYVPFAHVSIEQCILTSNKQAKEDHRDPAVLL